MSQREARTAVASCWIAQAARRVGDRFPIELSGGDDSGLRSQGRGGQARPLICELSFLSFLYGTCVFFLFFGDIGARRVGQAAVMELRMSEAATRLLCVLLSMC